MQDPLPGLIPAPPPSLRVLHDADGLEAVDKPPGLLVHPSALDPRASHSLTALLRERLGERLLPLHRLDRGTSGVLLLARGATEARAARAAFDARLVLKRYLALVRGCHPRTARSTSRSRETPTGPRPGSRACRRSRGTRPSRASSGRSPPTRATRRAATRSCWPNR